jgi:hypothetical protein
LLPNGQVLVVGGVPGGGIVGSAAFGSAELYDPATGSWRLASASPVRPIHPRGAVLLPTGKVLVVGDRSFQVPGAAVYDADTNSWASTASPPDFFNDLTLLTNGKVLAESGVFGGRPPHLYDPTTEKWVATASGSFSGRIAALLADGRALSVGARQAKLYNPLSETWADTGSMAVGAFGVFGLLRDGTVLGAGGIVPGTLGTPKALVEIYTPPTSSTVPSTCSLSDTRTNNAGRPLVKIAARDIGSGLQSIKVLTATNLSVGLPQFPSGSRDAAVVTATKINSNKPSVLKLQLSNRDGKTLTCSSVIAELKDQRGGDSRQVFSELPRTQSKVRLANGTPGLDRVDIEVNHTRLRLDDLSNGVVRTIDVASAMQPGTENTIVIETHGPRDSRALLVIGLTEVAMLGPANAALVRDA